jgi:hypothetical protein
MNGEERDLLLLRINENVGELREWKAALDERCAAHREKTEDLNETIFGNPGLKVEVQRLVNSETGLNKFYDILFSVIKTVIAGAILIFVFWLLSVYKIIN